MKRDFEDILKSLKTSIADYGYYCDFEKAKANVEKLKVELNILNSLIGSKNIEQDFLKLVSDYPNVLRAIPILIAVRKNEVEVIDYIHLSFNFHNPNYTMDMYAKFMRETGLFKLLEKSEIKDLVDYVLGVEVGLDSNARKNRTGFSMEKIVESYLASVDGIEYHQQMSKKQILDKYNINLDLLIREEDGKKDAEKKFDFVIKTKNNLYIMETNFYGGGGSKLNETSRSFKSLAKDVQNLSNVEFVWVTDGIGWISARNNLKETYDLMKHFYTIKDLEDGVFNKIFE